MLLEKLGILRFDGRSAFVDRAAIVGRSAVGGPKGGHGPGVAAIEGLDEGHGGGANFLFRRCRSGRQRRGLDFGGTGPGNRESYRGENGNRNA